MNAKQQKIIDALRVYGRPVFAAHEHGLIGKTYQTLAEATACDLPKSRRINRTMVRKLGYVDYYIGRGGECIALVASEDNNRPQNARSLTADQVREVRKMYASGKRVGDIARVFGVNQSTISQINSGKGYAWVDADKEIRTGKRAFNARQIRLIRRMLANGELQKDIARKMKVATATIGDISRGKSYQDVI